MKRATELRRTEPMKRGRKRPKAERVRIYGDEAHQAWLRGRGCAICLKRPVVLHHTRNGGTGRKADARWQVPLCDRHHREYHDHGCVEVREVVADVTAGGDTSITYRFTKDWFRQTAERLWQYYEAQQSDPERRSA